MIVINWNFRDFLEVTKTRVSMCKQLLTSNGSLLWFGIHHYIGFVQAIMYEAGLYYRRMNIWYYENGFSRTSKAPLAQYEPFCGFQNQRQNGHIMLMMSEFHIKAKNA